MIVLTKKEIDSVYHEAKKYSGMHKYSTFQAAYLRAEKRTPSYQLYCAWYDLVFGLQAQVFSASDIGPEQCMICDAVTRELMVYEKYMRNGEKSGRLLTCSEVGKLPTVFPSRSKARSAKFHHVMQSGEPMSHDRWEIVAATGG